MPDYGWLGGTLAGTVLAAAAYSVGRVVVGPLRGRRVQYDVDITHALMGASMAGMLVANLSFLSAAIWQVAFAVIIAWSAARAMLGSRSQCSQRPDLLYQTGSLLSVAAMLYMLHATPSAAMATTATTGAVQNINKPLGMLGDMAMPSAGSVAHTPAIALLFAALLLGYVVLVASRLHSMAAAFRAPGRASRDRSAAGRAARTHSPAAEHRVPLAPRAGAACEVVMCVAMSIMLIITP